MSRMLKAAIVQDCPVVLAIDEAIAHTEKLAKQAIETGASVIAFGESFIGGHPAWLEHVPVPALWDHPGTKELHALLLRQAIRGNDPRLAGLQWACDIAGVVISVGGYERVRSSLFNTQFLFRPKAPPLLHRKLVHAPGERMLLGTGDGSTLDVHQASWGQVGQLASAEHWMPLARAAMHHAGETVHIAAWPSVTDIALLASAHYAFEGRAFVLAAGTIQWKQDYIRGYGRAGGNGPGRELLDRLPGGDQLQWGRSTIIAPDGATIAQAGDDREILIADLDLHEVDSGLSVMNIDGQHARPDIFELRVDRRPRTGIIDVADEDESEAA